METDELVVVYDTDDEISLTFCRQVLEEAGIPVVEQKPHVRPLYHPVIAFGDFIYRLLVRAQDADTARALVMDYLRKVEAGDYALPDNQDVAEQ
ncbi:MAG TPA: DUF2007 domain-containing protein [Armatimonadota bacterium]|jgi:hypothetical protein